MSERSYTNLYHIPKAIARTAIALSERHEPGVDPVTGKPADFTVTQLLTPARIRRLLDLHDHEITTDVSDLMWTIKGSLAHLAIEMASTRIAAESAIERLQGVFEKWGAPDTISGPDALRGALRACHEVIGNYSDSRRSSDLQELRLYATVNGMLISGQIDMIDRKVSDLKVTSVQRMKDGIPIEYDWQINFYWFLIQENRDRLSREYGIDVDRIEGLELVAWYLGDWSPTKSIRSKDDYPPTEIEVFPINPRPLDEIKGHIWERVEAHKQARIRLPLCTDEERWRGSAKWAVVKKGAEKAYRLKDSAQEAEALRQSMAKPDTYEVEYREAHATRCMGVGTRKYCPVRDFCEQFRREKNQGHTFYTPARKE